MNFANQSVSGLNFGYSSTASANSVGSAHGEKPSAAGAATAFVQAQRLGTLQASTALATNLTGSANGTNSTSNPGLVPVPGYNGPVCQMLRNATWHQMILTSPGTTATAPAAATTPSAPS